MSASFGGDGASVSSPPRDSGVNLDGWERVPADELTRQRQRFAALAGGDLETELERWAADCELRSSVAGVLEGQGGLFRGREGVRAFQQQLAEAFEHIAFVPHDLRRRGRMTLTIGSLSGRGRRSGIEIAVPIVWLVQRNEGEKIVWAQAFGGLGEAIAAAARREAPDQSGRRAP